jgi:hypothetical protein
MREIARQPWSWVLYKTDEGRLVLTVNCGTVAAYEIFIELTDDESRSFNEEGNSSVDALAREVTANPQRFGARNVKLQGEEVVPAPLSWSR